MRYLRIGAALILASALVAPAIAEDARKIDFTAVLVDQDNEALKECADPDLKLDQPCKTFRPITLGMVAFRALVTPEAGISQDESFKRGQLGFALYKSTGQQLTAEETALLKRQIARSFGPLVVARAFPILDPATH